MNGKDELKLHISKLMQSAMFGATRPPQTEREKLDVRHDLLCQVDWILKEILEQLENNPEAAKANVADALFAVRETQDETMARLRAE
jgi:hypothetical protein